MSKHFKTFEEYKKEIVYMFHDREDLKNITSWIYGGLYDIMGKTSSNLAVYKIGGQTCDFNALSYLHHGICLPICEDENEPYTFQLYVEDSVGKFLLNVTVQINSSDIVIDHSYAKMWEE